MRAAVLELAGQPMVVVDDVDIEAPGVGEVAVADRPLRDLPQRPEPDRRRLPALHPARAGPRGRRAS